MAAPLLLAGLLPLVGDVLDKIFPDKQAADAAKLKMMELAQAGELAKLNAETSIATGQIDTNKIEAASTRLFVAGWRPAVGWTCAAGFGWATIGHPIATWVARANGWPNPPAIDNETLLYVLGGLLGLGALRSVEKVKKAA
jgi:hypothetical protein